MTIAIYGGSFDPPHIAHQEIIKRVSSLDFIDLLVVVPAFLNPLKKSSFLSPNERLQLMKKLIKECNKCTISDYEINNGYSTKTIETIEYLSKRYNTDKIYLVIGEDNFLILDKWYKKDEILKKVKLIVATRGKNSIINKDIKQLNVNINISSSMLREKLDLNFIPKIIKKEVKEIYERKSRSDS